MNSCTECPIPDTCQHRSYCYKEIQRLITPTRTMQPQMTPPLSPPIFNSPDECETEEDLSAYFDQQAYRGDFLYDLKKEETTQTKHDNEQD